jgi:hypothetical protein
MLYRLMAMRMLMTNTAIMSRHSRPLVTSDVGMATKAGEIRLTWLEFAPCAATSKPRRDVESGDRFLEMSGEIAALGSRVDDLID